MFKMSHPWKDRKSGSYHLRIWLPADISVAQSKTCDQRRDETLILTLRFDESSLRAFQHAASASSPGMSLFRQIDAFPIRAASGFIRQQGRTLTPSAPEVGPTGIDSETRALWLDSPRRYGLISRGFHWLMAALFAWHFAGAVLFVAIGDSAVTRFVGGAHLDIGFVLFALVLLRGGWGLANGKRRPPHRGRIGRTAAAVHMVIYGLMIVVPGIALLRQFGSAKPFSPFGIPVMPERAEKIDWMIVPGDLFHYWLGFLLLVIVLGHAGMAILHRRLWKDDVLGRMT